MFRKIGSSGVELFFSDKLKEEFFGDEIESINDIEKMADELDLDFHEAEEMLNVAIVSFLCASSQEFKNLFYFFCVIYSMQELGFLAERYVEIPHGSNYYFPKRLKEMEIELTDMDLRAIFNKCGDWDKPTSEKLRKFFKAFSESNYFDAKQ